MTKAQANPSPTRPRAVGRPAGADDTKEAILAAAEALFAERGFDATSTREISERSGLNKALLHYHFQSKEGVLAAVLDRHYAALGRALAAATLTATSTDERLRSAIDAYVEFLAAHRSFAALIQREAMAGRNVDEIARRTLPFLAMVTAWLEEELPAARRGALAAPQLLVSFYAMAAGSFISPPLYASLFGDDPFGATALAARKAHLHRMLALVLAELRAPKASDTRKGNS